MAGEAHVLVGCGGSGIQTLRRLNELLSQDEYWRPRLKSDIYYMVVDGDAEEIKDFEAAVLSDLAGVPDKPFITAVQLAQGETHLQPLVDQSFVHPFQKGTDREGQNRLLEHWWNRGPDDPFVAPAVRPLTDGAGQCPPVSYFLTWRALQRLEDDFRKLMEEIQKRKGGFGRFDELNFVIVAGLAGGTGRGSWELIAFKLRELFGEHGTPPTPRAFLFDSSLFDDVFERHSEQKAALMINALTGFSQLSCWTANRQAGHVHRNSVFRYQLPSLTTPKDPATDVLTVDLEMDVNNASPVDHAYVVFKQNEVAHLADHYQYYEMAGAAIYAALSKSSILRRAINSGFPYRGMATATFEVNAVSLRKYFEAQSRVKASKQLMDLNNAAVESKLAQFFERTRLRVDVTDTDPISRFQANPKGLFLERVLAKLDEKSNPRLSGLEKALEADDPEETRRLVRAVLVEDEALVKKCVAEVIADEKLDPAHEAEAAARELFQQTRSVANVKSLIEKIQAALDEETTEMPAALPHAKEDPVRVAEAFAGRLLPLLTRHFSEGESKKLLEITRRGIPRANYPALRAQIEARYEDWSNQIDRLRANADDLLHCVLRLEQKYAKQREETIPASDNVFRDLFTDPEFPESGLDQRFSARKFYRRELKPVLRKGQDLELLEGQMEMAKPLFDTLFDALLQQRGFSESEAFDVRRRLMTKVDQSIQDTVGINDDFIRDHFSIRKVIASLVQAWRGRLIKKLSRDVRQHLEERFEEFFGFRPQSRETGSEIEYEFPDTDEFILNLAGSMAKTCKPYWRLKRGSGRDFNVTLFVPTSWKKEAAEKHVNAYVNDNTIQTEVYPQTESAGGSSDGTANAFLLLAYSTQGVDSLDDIASLDYYTEPEISALLKETEDENGGTIFQSARNGGLGYVDPLYVRNERIRSLRWRPWFTADSQAKREELRAVDALLYALFPGDGKTSELLKTVRGKLESIDWLQPLIYDKGENRYTFSRLPLNFVGGKGQIDQQTQDLPGWNKNKPVATKANLLNCYNALNGVGRKHGTAWRDRIVAEAETFWGHVLPSLNVSPGTPAYRELLQEYQSWLGAMSRSVEDKDPSKEIWNKLLTRIGEISRA